MSSPRQAPSSASSPLTHSQLIKRRKLGTLTEPELARLHELDAASAARHRTKAKEPLTREATIGVLEGQLAHAGPKAAAALARRIALLQGVERPYAVKVADRQARDAKLAGGSAGLPRKYAVTRDGADSWVPYEELDDQERAELAALQAQVQRECPKDAKGWAEWDLSHPGRRAEMLAAVRGYVPEVVEQTKPMTETESESEKIEREKLISHLLGLKPAEPIAEPEAQPEPPYSADHMRQFLEFNATL